MMQDTFIKAVKDNFHNDHLTVSDEFNIDKLLGGTQPPSVTKHLKV